MHFGDERVIAGIPEEFVDRMRQAGGSTGHLRCTNPLAQTRTRETLDAGRITGLNFPGALVGAAPRL